MPFTGRAIDPNDLEFMRAAFNKACERLGLQCRREDRITDLVVDAIIEVAATGQHAPDRLCELALVRLKSRSRAARPSGDQTTRYEKAQHEMGREGMKA
jgi:hypothetical protein